MINVPMTLRHANGKAVKTGDTVVTTCGEEATVSSPVGASPHKTSSTGRIYVERDDFTSTYFPSVYGCRWHYDNPEAAEQMGLTIREDNIPKD